MEFSPPSDDDLLDLVGEIYDCAVQSERWPGVMERIAKLIGGTHAAIALHNVGKQNFTLQVNWNVPPDFERAMHEHLAINPFIPASWYVDVGEPISAFRFIGFEEIKRSLWYKMTHEPYEHGDSALILLARSASRFGSFSVHRRSWQPLFQDEQLSLLRVLSPHIRRAVMISDMLGARALERDMLAATLDRLSVGIVLTDGDGRIAHTNEAASRFFDDGGALRRIDDRLTALDPVSARDLAQAITDAARGTTIESPRSGIVVSLKGPSGADLEAWVLPLDIGLRREIGRREIGAGSAARVATFIRKPADTAPLPAELFVRRYDITPAECRVMMLVVQGMTIGDAAETLGISLPTAKTHLARLFEKTGTNRQADLTRLAMSALAPVS